MAPTHDDVLAAASRIEPFVHRTPVMTSRALDDWVGARVVFKCEHLQRVGAFKYRGATNAVQSLSPTDAARGVAAHSSGNHAAALALAAATRGIPAHVVMASTAREVKQAAVARYGATITHCENTTEAREAALREVIAATGASEVHPYDDDLVIAGAGTAALELVTDVGDLDVLVVPVGGGGLSSGSSIAAHGLQPSLRVIGAEPSLADDAARSLESGVRQPPLPPTTIADGLLTGLSDRTFSILSEHLETIVTVDEHEIVEAMRTVWERTKQLVEPSAAVAVAGARKIARSNLRVGIILSGGNVDLDALPW